MNLEHVQPDRAVHPQLIGQTDTRLHGVWLILARGTWIVLVLLMLVFLFVSLPTNFALLHQSSSSEWSALGSGQLTASELRVLPQYGISLDAYAWFWLVLTIGEALVWLAVGGILFWRKSDNWMALLVALLLISWGVNIVTVNLLYSSSIWRIPENGVQLLEGLSTVLLLALFPNGRSVPRWAIWITLLDPASSAIYLLFLRPLRVPGWALFNNPLTAVTWFSCWTILTIAQFYRYFRVSNTLERQQAKWLAFSFSLILLTIGVLAILPGPPSLEHNGLLIVLITVLILNTFSFISLLVPISFALAMFRYHLWDIDIIINRTLVYGTLTVCIVGLYVLVVGYLGILFRTSGNLLISLIAAGLVAVAFQPLRVFLQRAMNRLLYGLRDEPYIVLAGLGQRLQATLHSDTILSTIVQTVQEALKLPYVAIEVQEGATTVLAASSGIPSAKTMLRLPLLHQQEPVGTLIIAPRRGDTALTSADLSLVRNLADQIALAVHTVQLTKALQRMAADVQHSRERLVLAREEERRRLRRDLHDELGPTLAALALAASNISDLILTNPRAAVTQANSLQNDIRATVGDIRRLVYELRPPALDELGLVGAIRDRATQFSSLHKTEDQPGTAQRLLLQVEAPDRLPPLPAAIEVAAYRIVQEALTNVTRHAHACTCIVRLALSDALEVEILDDGIGLPQEYQKGLGLDSMRERAAELGGSCTIEKRNGPGTSVYARLPVAKE